MGRLKSGDLRNRITLMERYVDPETASKIGEPRPSYIESTLDVWAKIGAVKYLKAAIFKGAKIEADFEVKIRMRPGVDTSSRIKWRTQEFVVVHAVHDEDEQSTTMLVKSAKDNYIGAVPVAQQEDGLEGV